MINTIQRSYEADYSDLITLPHSPSTAATELSDPGSQSNVRRHQSIAALISRRWLGFLCCLIAAATSFAQPQSQPNPAAANPQKAAVANYDSALAEARAALKRGDYDEAITRADLAIKARPEDEAAKQLLEQAQQAKRDDKKAHDRALELAKEAMRSGDYEKAIELLTLVVQGWSGDTEAKELLNQARTANSARPDYEAALAAARDALNGGNFDTAIKRANEALRLRPGDRTATDLLVRANVRKSMAGSPEITTNSLAQTPKGRTAAPVQTVEPPPPATPGVEISGAAVPTIAKSTSSRNEIAASGDFFYGQGTVTLPIGFSMEGPLHTAGGASEFKKTVADPSRSSEYLGGTLSYSFNQRWYIDLSYAQGSSSGNFSFDTGDNKALNASFTIDDTWYQAYVRYAFRLRGSHVSAYLRAGASYVTASMTAGSVIPPFGLYKQTDETTDLLGNIGFGFRYSITPTRAWRTYLQVEGEGFFGTRSQDSLENLPQVPGFAPVTVKIDNALYGGIGRATLRVEHDLGKSGLWRMYGDVGFQAKFTLIQYSGASAPNEMLWGPYFKLGLRYAF